MIRRAYLLDSRRWTKRVWPGRGIWCGQPLVHGNDAEFNASIGSPSARRPNTGNTDQPKRSLADRLSSENHPFGSPKFNRPFLAVINVSPVAAADDSARLRSMRGRIGAYESWARTPVRAARTWPARKAALERFDREVDPKRELTPQEPVP